MNDLEIYNPANAKQLTAEQIAAMQNLTPEEIKELAKLFPNTASGKAFLVLKDKRKKDKDQLYPRSTWQNLANLYKQGAKHFVPVTFVELFSRKKAEMKTAPVQDLTKKEVKEGLKIAASQTAKEVVDENKVVDETKIPDPPPAPKNFDKMNKEELQAEFRAKFESEPDPKLTNKELREQLAN